MHLVGGIVGIKKLGELLVQLVDIIVEVGVLLGFDGRTCDYYAAGVNDTENGVGTTYVDTYYIRFAHFQMWYF